jgi:alpha-L-rhamnosidase
MTMMKRILKMIWKTPANIAFVFCLWCVSAPAAERGGAEVTDLRCESLKEPLGIDVAQPRLSWRIESPKRGERQTAYQVLVASSPQLLAADKGDLWDSGKVVSDQSIFVDYAGRPLESRRICYWKARVWTSQGGEPSAWSGNGTWAMGLLAPDDWLARWISASRWFMAPELRPPGFIAAGAPAWAQVELGKPIRIDSVKLYPYTAGEFPLRFRIEADDDMDFNSPKIIADCSNADFSLGGKKSVEFPGRGITASRVRVLILKPAQGKENMANVLGKGQVSQSVIRQMEVWSGGRNVALMRPTLQSGCSWDRGHSFFMVDGMPSATDGATCQEDACPTQTAPHLRKAFALDQPVKRATLYYAAHGMACISINGAAVEDAVLGPRFSDYGKRIYYRVVDVTKQLSQGQNVVGATLGNGFFSPPGRGFGQRHNGHGQPRLLLQLEVELADGACRTIVTDETWRWAKSEIVANDLWGSYCEDRRLAQPGWDKPGFQDAGWRVVGIAESMGGKLCAVQEPVNRILGRLRPSRVEGNAAFFDVLSAGWPRIEIKNGKAGQRIRLDGDWGETSSAVVHDSNGNVIRLEGDRSAPSEFILGADGPATLEPWFTWGSGPTRLTVTGLDEALTVDNISIQQVGTDLRPTGSFQCSNPWLNTLHEVVLRTHRNYCLDFPLDPMREKEGWTQDAQNFFNTAAYLTDVDAFYRRWWRDMADNQRANGLLGAVMPLMGQLVNDWNCSWWSGVIAWLPGEHYLYYGDRSFLEEAYEPIRKYVDYLNQIASLGVGTREIDYPDPHYFLDSKAAADHMLIWHGANDWQNPHGPCAGYVATGAGSLVNMAGWYHCANIVSQTAALMGKTADAEKYAAMSKEIARRTNRKFLDSVTGRYANQRDNQTAQVLPLGVGMVPPELREQTMQRLIDAIHARKDHHATGFVALPYLLRILAETRQSELANRIINQQDFPSWKTLVHHGVLAEGWNGGGAQMPSCGGSVGMWLYQSVLGIRPDPAGPGFKRFILAPQPDPATGLTSAEGWYDSAYGKIVSRWKLADGGMNLDVAVPPNTTATVYVPAREASDVRESGRLLDQAEGVKFLRMEQDAAVLEVGSGEYRFFSHASVTS